MELLWRTVSFFGSSWWLFPLTIFVCGWLFYKNKKNDSLFFALTMAISPLISDGLKNIVREIRPVNNLETSFSFPSGHALNSMVFYLLLINIFKIKNKFLIWVIISLIGLSRIFLGVHYWWDVAGGWIIGYGIYQISIKLLK